MRRREFIALAGGTLVRPFGVPARASDALRTIGVYMNLAEDDPESSARMAAFFERLGQLGWVEGRNLRTIYRGGPSMLIVLANMPRSWRSSALM
jgi:putative ABC transport system substrate-binding protein